MASHLILQLILTFWFLLPFGISEDSGEYPRIPVTYTYESQTVQKIRTGCRGTLFPDSKETHQIFYVIDATGTMKNVEPGSPIPIIFPFTTDGVMHHPHKRQLVRFDEICFPIQCNAPRCGRIVGPITSEQIPSPPTTSMQGHLSASNWNLATNMNGMAQTIASGLLSAGIPQKQPSVQYTDTAAAEFGQGASSHTATLHKSVTNAETVVSRATQKAATVATETHQLQSADSKIPVPVASLQTADISVDAADIGAILEPLIFQGTSTSAVNAASVENKAATSGMFPNGLGTHTESSSSSSYTYHHASPPQPQVHQTASASMASTVTSNKHSVIENPSLTNPIVFQTVSTSNANTQTIAANSASIPEVPPLTFQGTSTSTFSAATAKNNAAASGVVPEASSESQAASAASSTSEFLHSSPQSQAQTASSSMTLSSTDSSQKNDVLENSSPALELQNQAVSLDTAKIKEANSILSEAIPESTVNTETAATGILAAPEVNPVPLSVVQADTTALDTEQIIAFPMPTVVHTLTTSTTSVDADQTKPIVTENSSSATSTHQTHTISVDGIQEPVQAQTTFAAPSNTITVDNTQPAVPEIVAQHTPITFQDSISMDAVHNQAKPQILLAPEQELVPTPTHPLHRPTTPSVTSAVHGAMTNFATSEVQSVANSNTGMSMSQSQPAFQVQPLQNNIGFEQVTFSNGYPGVPPAPQPGSIPVTTNTVTTYTTQSNVNPSMQACPANCSPTPTQYATIAPSSLGSNPPAFASTNWPSWFPMPWLNFGRQNAAAAVATSSAKAQATVKKDANYYANLPGAIRGSTHVIYYPSCEKDAYYQPAIVNFCSYPHSAFTTYSKVTEQIM